MVAIASALTTRSVSCFVSIDHPMMRREWASMTAAQYSFPSFSGCSVMSVSHRRSGAPASNRRWTRSSSVAWLTRLRRPFLR